MREIKHMASPGKGLKEQWHKPGWISQEFLPSWNCRVRTPHLQCAGQGDVSQGLSRWEMTQPGLVLGGFCFFGCEAAAEDTEMQELPTRSCWQSGAPRALCWAPTKGWSCRAGKRVGKMISTLPHSAGASELGG